MRSLAKGDRTCLRLSMERGDRPRLRSENPSSLASITDYMCWSNFKTGNYVIIAALGLSAFCLVVAGSPFTDLRNFRRLHKKMSMSRHLISFSNTIQRPTHVDRKLSTDDEPFAFHVAPLLHCVFLLRSIGRLKLSVTFEPNRSGMGR